MELFSGIRAFQCLSIAQGSGISAEFFPSRESCWRSRGWNILIFPEGKTTEDGSMSPFRSGIGIVAQQLNLPVVPLKIDGLFELKRKHRMAARPGQVKVTIGRPVRFAADQDANEIAQELKRRVAEL